MASSSTNSSAAIFCICFIFISFARVFAVNVSHDGRAIIIDGTRRILFSGAIHYPRSTPQMWPDLMKKSKEGGLDVIDTYVFWSAHEPRRRHYDFSGNLDFIKFIKTIQSEGLYAFLRIGPYVCAEWNYGGFPVWLHNMPGIELRTENDVFMNEMQNFTTLIVNMVKKHKLFASQGGPIILAQIENEYGDVIKSYGEAGKAYRNWCAKMADSQHIGVPWIMCQDVDAPQPMIDTHNGYYCDQFTPNNPTSPKMWTESWIGWYKTWGDRDPHRPAEDVAYAIAKFYQSGGTFVNYYMYHGGTNFGRIAGGPYITTSYDYDAPLDEYGHFNQPKWGHMKQLHMILKSMEKTLTYGNVTTIYLGNSVTATIYTINENSSCFLANVNTTKDARVSFWGNVHNVPAWSVSILPDCMKEGYNSAKVNTQTSIMVKRTNNTENGATSLSWSWRPEDVNDMVRLGKGDVAANRLIDQKTAADDKSDYLWYMTSLNLKEDDPIWSHNMTLRVNATGQEVIHAYVNGHHIGALWGSYNVTETALKRNIKLKKGKKNLITLLSVTVGFQHYGAKFDLTANGILGPVELIAQKGEDEKVTKNLSKHKWTYKVGLHGLDKKYYNLKSHHASKWRTDHLPVNKMMTWYKTNFKTPPGTDPVVVDMQGLGKGQAWVNGHSIGRYWPTYLAYKDGCGVCDYRGAYNSTQCLTNCGQPSQRWYHIPRSFLKKEDVNTLVLFEEMGGNPFFIDFQTVNVGVACGNAYEKNVLELSCESRPISAVKFASFGNPRGSCGSFEKGKCEGKKDALSIIRHMCVGKEKCSIDVSEDTFGSTNCSKHIAKRLAVEAVC